jgi:hypothetical protein
MVQEQEQVPSCDSGASGWVQVGWLLGNRIVRDDRENGFHSVCDAVGPASELYEIAEPCCNVDGTLRFGDLPGLDRDRDSASSHGRALHVHPGLTSPRLLSATEACI